VSVLIEQRDGAIHSVLHPTDLSEASLNAFHHALAVAIRRGAEFTLLHAVGRRSTDSWADFPAVRETLARWGEHGSTSGLEKTIRQSVVSKREVPIRDPVAACLEHIERHATDMIVLATEGRSASRLVRASRAETLAREARLFTLFVPAGGRPFVSADTGQVGLRKILLPVDPTTDPRPAMLRAVQAAALLDDPTLEITLLHIGDSEELSSADVPHLPFCRWSVVVRRGDDVVRGILGVAGEIEADAIYMSSSWRKPSWTGLKAGVTEKVIQSAPCPVAVVPVG
jgi:nucleotide-binding universal stress UspA family protein